MPTDIRDILTTTQDTIDKAVNTIKKTTKTQSVLEDNIKITDRKIKIHNEDPEAHPDIRGTISDLPSMVDDPVVSGPDIVESGEENSWLLQTVIRLPTLTLTKFVVTTDTGKVIELPTTTDSAVFRYTFEGERFSDHFFTVVGVADPGNFRSHSTKHNFVIRKNLPPDMTNFSCSLPIAVNREETYTFQITGIEDADDGIYQEGSDIVSIEILECPYLTFSKRKIEQGEDLTVTIAADAPLSQNVIFQVKATDSRGASSTASVTLRINSNPDVSTITIVGLVNNINQNSTFPMSIGGVTDPDNDPITYNVTSSNPAITFSKSEGIELNELFDVIVGAVEPGSSYNLTFEFIDKYGGKTKYTVSSTINNPPDISNLVATFDNDNTVDANTSLVYPGQDFTLSISGVTDTESDQKLTFILEDPEGVFEISKNNGIEIDEKVTITVKESAERGRDYPIKITTVDESGGKTSITKYVTINSLPDLTNMKFNLSDNPLVPGRVYTDAQLTGAADRDTKYPLQYTITSSTATITGGDKVLADTDFTVTAPTEDIVPRGETVEFTIEVFDGLETVSKTITIVTNTIPTTEDLDMNVNGNISGRQDAEFVINGGSADTSIAKYHIEPTDSSLITVKKTPINIGEKVTLICKKVTDIVKTFVKVYAIDSLGEQSDTYIEKEVTILPDVRTQAPVISYPTNGDTQVPYEGHTQTWSEYKGYIQLENSVQHLTYNETQTMLTKIANEGGY